MSYLELCKRYSVTLSELRTIDTNSRRFELLRKRANKLSEEIKKFDRNVAIKTFNSRSGNYKANKRQIMKTLLTFFE